VIMCLKFCKLILGQQWSQGVCVYVCLVGWGTARVAVGMGIGQLVFEHVKRWLSV
jgi:hypothetical protein